MGAARPVLYSFRRCPYAMRARLALAASGQGCELREVVLRDKPAALLRASPKGTVPVLVLPDGAVIEQSLDIMLWALGRHDPQGWLRPESGGLEDMLALIAACDSEFKPCLDRYKYPDRYENIDPSDQRSEAAQWLAGLESRLSGKGGAGVHEDAAGLPGPGLSGARAALADAAIMPFVRQFAQVDRAWFDAQPWPALRGWLSAWTASALFASIMEKHTPWDGTQGVSFP